MEPTPTTAAPPTRSDNCVEVVCSRCGGTGLMPFPHVKSGECFRCGGSGVTPREVKLARQGQPIRYLHGLGYRDAVPLFMASQATGPDGQRVYYLRIHDEPAPFYVPLCFDRVGRKVLPVAGTYPGWASRLLPLVEATIFPREAPNAA